METTLRAVVYDLFDEGTEPPPQPPSPVPVPPGPAERAFTAIKTTCWGNREDEPEEWEQMAYPWSPPCRPGSGKTTLGAALPARVDEGTAVSVQRLTDGTWSEWWPVIDLGPSVAGESDPNDPWWITGKRPESEATGRAALDLTPACWAWILGRPVEEMWAGSPSGLLSVRVRLPVKEMLSAHFSVEECTRSARARAAGIDNSLPVDLRGNAAMVASQILEPIRVTYGPFSPSSWYRCEALNATTPGSSDTSQHLRALAVDVPRTQEMWQAIVAAKLITSSLLVVQVEADHYHVAFLKPGQTAGVVYLSGVEPKEWEK